MGIDCRNEEHEMLAVNNLRLEKENHRLRQTLWDDYFKATIGHFLRGESKAVKSQLEQYPEGMDLESIQLAVWRGAVMAAATVADEMLKVREARAK